MRNHRRVAIAPCKVDRSERLGQRANLVDLDENRVGDILVDALGEDRRVGDKNVVANQLNRSAKALGQQAPAVPVVLAHGIFNGDDGVTGTPVSEVIDELGRTQRPALRFEDVLAVVVKLRRRAVQTDGDVDTRLVTRNPDRLHDQTEGSLVPWKIGRESALVAHGGGQSFGMEQLFERMEHLRAVAQGITEGRRAQGDDHEFLQVEAVVSVSATVDDVHQRHRQRHAAHAAQIAVQRQASLGGSGFGNGHRHCQHGVGAQAAFVLGAVKVNQSVVDERLFRRVQADDCFADLGIHRLNRA